MDRSDYLARVLSISALALCIAAFVAILLDGAAKAPAAAGSRPQLERLEASAGRVARTLASLRTTDSARSARDAVRRALADNRAVDGWLKRVEATGLHADPRLGNAVEAQYEYLDAIGSLLVNPRSLLAGELAARATRARAAFASLGERSALPASVRGWQRVAARAAARR
jgi:hypothetical protein